MGNVKGIAGLHLTTMALKVAFPSVIITSLVLEPIPHDMEEGAHKLGSRSFPISFDRAALKI